MTRFIPFNPLIHVYGSLPYNFSGDPLFENSKYLGTRCVMFEIHAKQMQITLNNCNHLGLKHSKIIPFDDRNNKNNTETVLPKNNRMILPKTMLPKTTLPKTIHIKQRTPLIGLDISHNYKKIDIICEKVNGKFVEGIYSYYDKNNIQLFVLRNAHGISFIPYSQLAIEINNFYKGINKQK